MPRTWILPVRQGLGLLGLLWLASLGLSQTTDLKPYRLEAKPPFGDQLARLIDLKSGKTAVKGPDYKNHQALLKQAAQSLVFRVTQEGFYNPNETGELKARPLDQTIEGLFSDLSNRMLVPTPDGDLPRMNPNQAEYVIEFGIALDAAVAEVFKKQPPAIIRVNAARVLAEASRSGAPALGKTITAMLTHTYFKDAAGKPLKTPPEVFYYALVAAENLLAAYDVTAINSNFVTRHALPEAELVLLLQTLETMVLKGPPVAELAYLENSDRAGQATQLSTPPEPMMPPAPMGPSGPMNPMPTPSPPSAPAATTALKPEQIAVVRYYRRAAIRALAKVRFDVVGGRGIPEVRPGYTLARVALNDQALSLSATPADITEATIGLAGLSPTGFLNVDVWALALAQGLINMTGPRLADDEDKSLPWKLVSARANLALTQLSKNIAVTPRLRGYAKPLGELVSLALNDIVTPLGSDTQAGINRPSIDRLSQWIQANPSMANPPCFYNDGPQYTFQPRRPGT